MSKNSTKKNIVLFCSLIVFLVAFFLFVQYGAAKEGDFVGKAVYDKLSAEQKQAYWDCFKTNKCSELLAAEKNKEYRDCSLSCNKQAKSVTENMWCDDSDKGDNFFEKGIVKSNIYQSGKEDSCYTFPNGKNYLFEGRCKDNKYQYLQKNCAELGNYFCDAGSCKKVEKYVVAVQQGSAFMDVATYFAEKKKATLIVYSTMDALIPELKDVTYLAVVYDPEELTPDVMHELDEKLRTVDDDPFLDVAFGIITSFTKEDAFVYVDRILNYVEPSEPTVYNPNPDYLVKKLEMYDVKTTFGCLTLFNLFSVPCSKEEEHTMKIVSEEATKNSILWLNVHGNPGALLLGNNEKIIGSPDGAIGLSFKSDGVKVWCGNDEYLGEYEENDTTPDNLCLEKVGTLEGMKKQSTSLYDTINITTSASLVIADSCITARINGTPTFTTADEEKIMTDEKGVINTSILLSFLKSGAYAYFGSTILVMREFFATQEIIDLAILNGDTVGNALKQFKNRNILVTLLVPQDEEYTKKVVELETRSWFLFGDPSMKISSKKIQANNCVKKVEKKKEGYAVTVYFDKNVLNGNFNIIAKIIPQDGTNFDIQNGEACLIRLPKTKESYTTNLQIPEGYIAQTMWDTGDEIFIIVPRFKSGVDITFEVT